MNRDQLQAMQPKVSIGMPVYNGERYIADALQSLLAQTFSDFEIIVADNHSGDRTAEIVAEFQARDARIRYYCQDENIGAVENFNDVKAHARGEFFMWAAVDDLWDSEWIDCLLDNFRDDCAISFGHVANINGVGEVVREYRPHHFGNSRTKRLASYFLAEEFNGKANTIYGLYRTEMVNRHRLQLYHGCTFGFDMHFVFDCIQAGRLVCDDRVMIYKRHEDGVPDVRSLVDRAFNSLLMFDRISYFITYVRIANNTLDKLLLALLLPVKYVKSLLFNLWRVSRKSGA